jgi:glycosyltransferase involved in cell wall biosynthesis
MRVALVVPIYLPHPGGIQKHVEELAAGLLRRGISVDILAQEKDRSLPALATDGNLTVRRFPVPLSLPRYTIAPALLRYLRRNARSYDIVHAHNYHELVPLFVARSTASNSVLTTHYHPPSGSRLSAVLRIPHRVLSGRVLHSFDRIICVTAAESTALRTELPALAAPVQVIPNGVDADRIRASAPMDIGRPYVLSVGRLEATKRVDRVIRAAASADQLVVVAGDGPERDALERLAASTSTAVRFLGRICDDELHRWIRGAAVAVTMSEREAFGLVILEAFAAGVPVVASDIPAHRETVGYGPPAASVLVPLGVEPVLLAQSITEMVNTGPHGFQAAVPTWDDMAAQTATVYEELLASRPR